MITAAELTLLETADPNGVFPGINETVGNPLPTPSLKSYTTITTNQKAPVYYEPSENTVVVKGNGAVLSGYNFSGAEVTVYANNATIENCTFSDISPGYNSLVQENPYHGMTVENCTFNGGDNVNLATFIDAGGYATITGNSFINVPSHDIGVDAGVVSNNYFSGGGYLTGAHPDAINVYNTIAPVTISGNFIDWTNNASAAGDTNNAIRITTDSGDTSDVTVTNNVILGGNYSILAQPSTILWVDHGSTGTVGTKGVMTNVDISNNYVGFAVYGAYYNDSVPGVTYSGNHVFDYTNPVYSEEAWAAYAAAGVKTTYLVTSTGAGLAGYAAGSSTLYGAGYNVGMHATGMYETVFVGGAGAQYMTGGTGENIFKYLAISDSPANGQKTRLATSIRPRTSSILAPSTPIPPISLGTRRAFPSSERRRSAAPAARCAINMTPPPIRPWLRRTSTATPARTWKSVLVAD